MHNNDWLSKVNNQQTKRLEPRMCYSVAGVNNPKNNSKKVETATKRNNAKINSKNDDAIKIAQKNNELILNRIIANRELISNQPIESDYYPGNRGGASLNYQPLQILQPRYSNPVTKFIDDIKSRKIKNQNEKIKQIFYKIVSNITHKRPVITSKANEGNLFNIHNNDKNFDADQNPANVTFGQENNYYPSENRTKIHHYAEPKTTYVPQIHNTSSQINNIKDHTSINQPIESNYYARNRGGASVNYQQPPQKILQSRYLEDGINNTKKKKNQYKARLCY